MHKEQPTIKKLIAFLGLTAFLTAAGIMLTDPWILKSADEIDKPLGSEPRLGAIVQDVGNRTRRTPDNAARPIENRYAERSSHLSGTTMFEAIQLKNAEPGWSMIHATQLIAYNGAGSRQQAKPQSLPQNLEFEVEAPQQDSPYRFNKSSILEESKKNDSIRWMKVAMDEIGITEVPGLTDNPRILEYHSTTLLSAKNDETPWNSSFVNWVFAQLGMNGTGSAQARSWLNWGYPINKLKLGCVAILGRRSKPWAGHVGFFLGFKDKKMAILGGNQDGKLGITQFLSPHFLGCRWPNEVNIHPTQS